MDQAATVDTNRNLRVGKSIRIRRTDGSGRIHEAICTETNSQGVGLFAWAVFAVGEVLELVAGASPEVQKTRRVRVLYRRASLYGLAWLPDPAPGPSRESVSHERLAAARKLLDELKAAYRSLPSTERAAVRRALREQAAPAVA